VRTALPPDKTYYDAPEVRKRNGARVAGRARFDSLTGVR
jgi:hypothetical protein